MAGQHITTITSYDNAMKLGKLTSRDNNPVCKFAEKYTRAHMVLTDLDMKCRFPVSQMESE